MPREGLQLPCCVKQTCLSVKKVQKQTENHAYEQASGQRKIDSQVLPLPNHVPGQTPQGKAGQEMQQGSQHRQYNASNDKPLAQGHNRYLLFVMRDMISAPSYQHYTHRGRTRNNYPPSTFPILSMALSMFSLLLKALMRMYSLPQEPKPIPGVQTTPARDSKSSNISLESMPAWTQM